MRKHYQILFYKKNYPLCLCVIVWVDVEMWVWSHWTYRHTAISAVSGFYHQVQVVDTEVYNSYCYYWIMGVVVYCGISSSIHSGRAGHNGFMSNPQRHSKGRVCLSWGLHQIEVSIFLPFEIPNAVPQWIHFTPGNSFLRVWVHVRLTHRQTGRRRKHRTFKPPSNNGFVISQQMVASSQSQPLPFSNFISSASFLSRLVFLSVFPTQTSTSISLCFSNRFYRCQLQTLLAVIGYSSQPWNDPTEKKKNLQIWTIRISCKVKPAVPLNVACK